ncbi:MAG: prenyltransferase, partial [Methanobacteriota archaeon]
LPVLGVYLTQTGFYTPQVVVASIPPGILTFNLLLLNEIPDIEADKTGGRRHIPIMLGAEKSAEIYTLLTATVFIFVTIPAIIGLTPKTSLIGLLTIPIAIKASKEALSNGVDRLLTAMGYNTLLVLVTPTLLGVGYLLDATPPW